MRTQILFSKGRSLLRPIPVFWSSSENLIDYAEKPWLEESWLSLHKKSSLKDALHGGWMMEVGVLPFRYNHYEWVFSKAMECQASLAKEELLMLMSLGVKYRVRLSPMSEIIENQLFLRIHKDYELVMVQYQDKINKEMHELLSGLEIKSRDYFELLAQQGEDDLSIEKVQQGEDDLSIEKVQQGEDDLSIEKVASPKEKEELLKEVDSNMHLGAQKEFSIQDLLTVASLLESSNSKNLSLIQYLQEVLTVKLEGEAVSATTALQYLSFLTFACKCLMAEYQENKQKYTARSLKRIYKYQYYYFQEHFRQLISSDATSSPEFLQKLLDLYGQFPIKRRELRRKIGFYVTSQIKRFELAHRQDLLRSLMELNKKDPKMNKQYLTLLEQSGPEGQPTIEGNQCISSL